MSAIPPVPKPVTVPEFRAAKARGEKLVVVTAYDYTSAKLADELHAPPPRPGELGDADPLHGGHTHGGLSVGKFLP